MKFFRRIFNFFSRLFGVRPPIEVSEVVAVAHLRSRTYLCVRSTDHQLWLYPSVNNGASFRNRKRIQCRIAHSKKASFVEKIQHCSDWSFSSEGSVHYLTYTRKVGKTLTHVIARSRNTRRWYIISETQAIAERSYLVPHFQHHNRFMLMFGEKSVGIATSADRISWNVMHDHVLSARDNGFDHAPLKIIFAQEINEGILVLYDASYETFGHQIIQVGAALLAKGNPEHVLWRPRADGRSVEEPTWSEFIPGNDARYRLLGGYLDGEDVHIYYASKNEIKRVVFPQPYATLHVDQEKGAALDKVSDNPVLGPVRDHAWESVAAFNPAAVLMDDKVHLLYRATGYTGMSVIGYASSDDGVHFGYRGDDPVYVPRKSFEGVGVHLNEHNDRFVSGANWDGCEDPRVTVIDGRIYMIYAAYNGYEQARLAMTWISEEDFRAKNWNWSAPAVMSPRATRWGAGNKNSCILPEKVNGKYVVFHRIWPNICIDYVDDLEFGPGKRWLTIRDTIPVRGSFWDSHKVGIGATPIKTELGWLVIYQGVGSQDPQFQYKIGAMILDFNDPSKVLYRSRRPILEPTESYEIHGHVGGVAYACGAVVKDDMLYVYYGGADTVVCVATAPMDRFMEKLTRDADHDPKLLPVEID